MYMIEEIKSKLDNNIYCDLNVEELKILYAIDNEVYEELSDYRNKRDNYYEDFCKIFGEEHVASNPKEITENTICYSSLLIINDKLPTYNLKYAYSISYDIADYYDGHIYNLENLEIVYNHFMILAPYFYESEFPQNLQKVFKNLYLKFNYYDYLDLSNIDYLKRLQLDIKNINFENIILPNKLDCLFISNYIDSKDIPHNINELILNRCIVKDNYLKLSSTIEKVSFINMKINHLNIESNNVKDVELYDIHDANVSILPKNIQSLVISHTDASNLNTLTNLKKLCIKIDSSIDYLPDGLEVLNAEDMYVDFYFSITFPDSLKDIYINEINQIYRYKEILPKNINIYVGGIKQSYDDIFGSKKLII